MPHLLTSSVIQSILSVAHKYKANVDVDAIRPTVEWRNTASDLATSGASPNQRSAAKAAASAGPMRATIFQR